MCIKICKDLVAFGLMLANNGIHLRFVIIGFSLIIIKLNQFYLTHNFLIEGKSTKSVYFFCIYIIFKILSKDKLI